jgi:predicted RNase H-like HicB family nuclease
MVPEVCDVMTQRATLEEPLAIAREAVAPHVEGLAEDGLASRSNGRPHSSPK